MKEAKRGIGKRLKQVFGEITVDRQGDFEEVMSNVTRESLDSRHFGISTWLDIDFSRDLFTKTDYSFGHNHLLFCSSKSLKRLHLLDKWSTVKTGCSIDRVVFGIDDDIRYIHDVFLPRKRCVVKTPDQETRELRKLSFDIWIQTKSECLVFIYMTILSRIWLDSVERQYQEHN